MSTTKFTRHKCQTMIFVWLTFQEVSNRLTSPSYNFTHPVVTSCIDIFIFIFIAYFQWSNRHMCTVPFDSALMNWSVVLFLAATSIFRKWNSLLYFHYRILELSFAQEIKHFNILTSFSVSSVPFSFILSYWRKRCDMLGQLKGIIMHAKSLDYDNDNGNCNIDELWRMKIKKFPHALRRCLEHTPFHMSGKLNKHIDSYSHIPYAFHIFIFSVCVLRSFEAVNFNYYPFYFASLLLSSSGRCFVFSLLEFVSVLLF